MTPSLVPPALTFPSALTFLSADELVVSFTIPCLLTHVYEMMWWFCQHKCCAVSVVVLTVNKLYTLHTLHDRPGGWVDATLILTPSICCVWWNVFNAGNSFWTSLVGFMFHAGVLAFAILAFQDEFLRLVETPAVF